MVKQEDFSKQIENATNNQELSDILDEAMELGNEEAASMAYRKMLGIAEIKGKSD